jgi:hypothetical protein
MIDVPGFILLSVDGAGAAASFPDDWLITLLSSLGMLTGIVLFTAALDVWLRRVLGNGHGSSVRRTSTLTLPAGADPNAEPRGRLIPQEHIGRTPSGLSQMQPRPDRHRRVR